jgi:hypothetical protein
LPDSEAVQIDKRDGQWLLTYWIDPDTTIRLHIRHASYFVSPDEFVCEIADPVGGHEFQEVGRLLWHPADDPSTQEWPTQWRPEFRQLANLWFVLATVATWGLALGSDALVGETPSTGEIEEADNSASTVAGASYA